MKIHLISYGDARYQKQRAYLKETAMVSSFFDELSIFSKEDIDPGFLEDFQDIFSFRKGGGYMIWKPYFIKKALDALPEGDILIYCDAGCMVNDWGKERFDEYIVRLNNSKKGVLAFELKHKEYQYTKREVFNCFQATNEVIKTNQIISGILFFKKCEQSCKVVNEWYQTIYNNRWLFTDQLDKSIQDPRFLEHRHDQSILSVILKKYGAEVLTDETYFDDFMRKGHEYPFWATRMGYFDI